MITNCELKVVWKWKTFYIVKQQTNICFKSNLSYFFTALFRCILYLAFITIVTKVVSFPLFCIRPMYLSIRRFKNCVRDIVLSRRAIKNMNTLLVISVFYIYKISSFFLSTQTFLYLVSTNALFYFV